MRKIILSRTDSIGDVVLTLPMAGVLKELFPDSYLIFLGKDYTRDVAALSFYVDEFVSWDDIIKLNDTEQQTDVFRKMDADTIIHVFPRKEIARLSKRAGIKNRIGTTGRLYHYFACNQRVCFSRKRSDLHEAQLNLKLLKPMGWDKMLTLSDIISYYGFTNIPELPENLFSLLESDKINLILHPKSKGSAREWGIENFTELIRQTDKSKYKLFVTGTEEEGRLIRKSLSFDHMHCTDLTGKMNLNQLIAFISRADALVAASTGPLHLAAALGKVAVGIYPPIRPMHPGRWAPLGEKASYLVLPKNCNDCRKGGVCQCMVDIKANQVIQKLEVYFGK